MRLASRIDINQPEIVDALRKIGASVQSLHTIGKGCPDLLVGYQGVNYLFEIKNGKKPKSARKLTADEIEWHKNWRGLVETIMTVGDALNIIYCGTKGCDHDYVRL